MKNKLTMPENVLLPERKRKQALGWYRKRPFLYTFLLLVLLYLLLAISLEVFISAGESEVIKERIATYIAYLYPPFSVLMTALAFNTCAGKYKEKGKRTAYWLCKAPAILLFILALMGLQGVLFMRS